MILFSLIPSELESQFTAQCLFVILGLKNQSVTAVGKPEEIRIALRDHYFMHLHLLLDRYISKCTDERSPIYQRSLEAVRKAQAQHIKVGVRQWANQFPDHVSLARELEPLTNELNALLPLEDRAEAFELLENLLATIKELANDENSLWVRGTVETLSGERVHTWMKNQKAA